MGNFNALAATVHNCRHLQKLYFAIGDDSFVVHMDLSLSPCTEPPDRAILRPRAGRVKPAHQLDASQSVQRAQRPLSHRGGDRQGRLSGRPLLVACRVLSLVEGAERAAIKVRTITLQMARYDFC